MKFKFLKAALTGLILTVTSLAQAGIINVNNTGTEYATGHFANLQGLDWLSWDTAAGLSRQQVENGALGLVSDGWRYASVFEINTLFNSLKKGYFGTGYFYSNWSDGSNWLWKSFDSDDYINNYGVNLGRSYSRIGDFRYGKEGECSTNTLYGCRGHMRAGDSDSYGWMKDTYHNGSMIIADSSTWNNVNDTVGHALVRSQTAIPEPSTIAIFALGMIGLASRRFKKQS